MPTTSSLISPITGKRECFVSMISGMNSGGASSIDTQSICARGIMMSRTVVSDTDSTPSIIDSASASSRRRSNAPRSSAISSSRSSGSRVRNADSRSSSVGLSSGESSGVAIEDSPSRVRIAVAEAAQQRDLPRLHAARVVVALVVVALQVQHAVDHQVRVVRSQASCAARAPRSRTTGAHSTMSPASDAPSSYTNVSTLVA